MHTPPLQTEATGTDATKLTRRSAALGLGAACLGLQLAGCAAPTVARGDLLQQMDLVLRQAQASNGFGLAVVPDQVTIGQRVALQVRAPVGGYLYVIQLATDGQSLSLVFPNSQDGRNRIAAGETLLPREGWRFSARGPAGVGYVLAIVAHDMQDLTALQNELSMGRIRMRGAYQAAMAPMTERAA